MTHHYLITVFLLSAALLMSACSGSDSRSRENKIQAYGTHGPKRETAIVLPNDITVKWKAVKIAVINKTSKRKAIYQIPVNGVFLIPDSSLSIKVDAFIPDFVMEGATITSASSQSKNPAVKVTITEEERKGIYKGWLFARFPTTHAFIHPVYAFMLVSGVPSNK